MSSHQLRSSFNRWCHMSLANLVSSDSGRELQFLPASLLLLSEVTDTLRPILNKKVSRPLSGSCHG